MPKKRDARLIPRLRVMDGDTVILGPGKADLLEAIQRRGSLRDAAADLDMSYMRAWNLVQTMNTGFRDPVVALRRGGAGHGSAELTDNGRKALQIYRAMESKTREATRASWTMLRKLIR